VRTAAYIAILVALAALIAFLPGGGTGARLFTWLVGIVFWGALAWFLARLYREHREDIYGLGDRMRAVLYVSVGAIVLTVAATSRLWDTPAGMLAWFAAIGAALYGLFAVWRHYREY
jgi:surface polysaccharide O-acyltransferase-like enzyme